MINKIYLSWLMFFALISCQKEQSLITNDVNIEIVNKQVNCIGDSLIRNRIKLFYNLKEQNDAKNIVTYKISNHSKNKYFFVLDEDLIEVANQYDVNNCMYCKKSKLFYDINTNKNKKPKYFSSKGDSFTKVNDKFDREIYRIEEVRYKLSELNYSGAKYDYDFSNSIRKNSFVLYPNQTKYFQCVVYLPLKESSYYDNTISYFTLKSEMEYSFNLIYIADSTLLKKNLQKHKLKELKENSIKIFDGKLISNKIPLNFINY